MSERSTSELRPAPSAFRDCGFEECRTHPSPLTWPLVTLAYFPIRKDISVGSISRMIMNSVQRRKCVVMGARQNTFICVT